jgi:hypothetical protein
VNRAEYMLNIKSTTSPFDLGLCTVIDIAIPYEDMQRDSMEVVPIQCNTRNDRI